MTGRKTKSEGDALVLHIGDESFALTAEREIDGEKVMWPSMDWLDQLSFREQIEVRKLARELSGVAEGDFGDFAPMDLAPALITVVNQRTNKKFTLDDALDMNWEQATARPTKAS